MLRSGDQVEVRVWPDSSLSGRFTVDDAGRISLPGVGEIEVTNIALSELRALLRRRYEQGMRNPVVSLNAFLRVSVLGSVQRPGLFYVEPGSDLFDVLSLAGGFSNDADQNKVRVLRGDKAIALEGTINLDHGDNLVTMNMLSGDRIIVPRRRSFNYLLLLQAGTFIVSVATLLTTR